MSELSLLNGDAYLEFLPSVIAASAIAIARHTLGFEAWDQQMSESTGYELSHLTSGIDFLNKMFENAPSMAQHAIQDKYKSTKLMSVSQMKPNEAPIVCWMFRRLSRTLLITYTMESLSDTVLFFFSLVHVITILIYFTQFFRRFFFTFCTTSALFYVFRFMKLLLHSVDVLFYNSVVLY